MTAWVLISSRQTLLRSSMCTSGSHWDGRSKDLETLEPLSSVGCYLRKRRSEEEEEGFSEPLQVERGSERHPKPEQRRKQKHGGRGGGTHICMQHLPFAFLLPSSLWLVFLQVQHGDVYPAGKHSGSRSLYFTGNVLFFIFMSKSSRLQSTLKRWLD